MELEKFDWNKANHAKQFDNGTIDVNYAPEELIVHDASAQDTQKAYNALVNHGLVSDFKVEVWNDIIGKMYDIANVLDPKITLRRFKATRIGLLTPDKQQWIDYAHKTFPQLDTDEEMEHWLDVMWERHEPGVMKTYNFNSAAHNCLPEFFGNLPYVNVGDELKGEYILQLVDMLNCWIDIDPLPLSRFEEYVSNISVHFSFPEPISVYLVVLSSLHDSRAILKMIQSTQGCIRADYRLLMESLRIAQLRSVPFSSVINFMLLKMSVNVLDKWPIYFEIAEAYNLRANVKVRKLSRLPFGFADTFLYAFSVNCVYSGSLSFRVRKLEGKLVIQAVPDMSDSLPFDLRFVLNHDTSRIRVRTRRPLPLAIVDEYVSGSRVRVEHEGIEIIEKADDVISLNQEAKIHDSASVNMGKSDRLSLTERKLELSKNQSANFNVTDGVKITGEQVELKSATVHYVSHKGKTIVEGDTTFTASEPQPLAIDNRTLKTRDFFEVGFANEQSFKAKDGKLKTNRESITLDFSPQIDLLHEGLFDTSETMFLEHTYGIGMEADVSFTSASSSRLESNRTKELEGESVIGSVYLAELLFGLNAYLESEINGFSTAYEASMYKYHIQGIDGVEQFIRTLDASILSKVMDKVIAGQAVTTTEIRSLLLARLMRFLVSNQNVSTVNSDAQGTAAHPRIMNPKAIPVESSLDVFLDASYVGRDEALVGDGRIGFDLNVEPVVMTPAESFRSALKIEHETSVSLEETLSKRQEGTAISSSTSEASCTLARVSLTWAIDLEDVLVSEKDNILVNEVERTLYF